LLSSTPMLFRSSLPERCLTELCPSLPRCRGMRREQLQCERLCESLLLLLWFLGALRCRAGFARDILDAGHCAVALDERLVGHAPYVGLRDLLHAIDAAEEFAPIAVACLIDRQLAGQPFVVCQPANQPRLGARLHHLQFVVAYILRLDALNLLAKCFLHFCCSVPLSWYGIEGEEVGKFVSGKAAEARGHRGDLLVTHQRAIESRGAPLRKQI